MDYVIFLHGVNTRARREAPDYAKHLCKLIETSNHNSGQQIVLKMLPLYWGDVTEDLEDNLLKVYRQSKYWHELSFRDLREKQLLQFTGDAALYISRYVGTRVVDTLLKQVKDGIGPGPYNQDRLHLVTHSWGTVIFFDILFSGRWDTQEVSSYQGVKQIRNAIFGLEPAPKSGLRLCSIHTMGSPISIFSLFISTGEPCNPAPLTNHHTGVDIPSTHDITPGLSKWLKRLPYQIPWYNYIHPEDLIAYPLQELIPQILKNSDSAVNDKLVVKDKVTAHTTGFLNTVEELGIPGNLIQKIHIGSQAAGAHHSYWVNPIIAHTILRTIREARDTHATNSHNSLLQGMKDLIRR